MLRDGNATALLGVAVGLVAAGVPAALRASRTNPVETLRAK